MKDDFTARQSITIDAEAAKVWNALTDPKMIKLYLFGTEVFTDWKEGSAILYRGIWKGKNYEDKGKVIRIVPGKLIESTFWSELSGLPDIPENYKNVTYELTPAKSGTMVTVIQDNNASEEEKNHSEQNWNLVLKNLKELLEHLMKD